MNNKRTAEVAIDEKWVPTPYREMKPGQIVRLFEDTGELVPGCPFKLITAPSGPIGECEGVSIDDPFTHERKSLCTAM